ncbi:DUF4199 domain-containing protein [Paraflavitalea pollutisoli]|uniref:DUF4199 domain-containing protein n=1 Tax=Paraflavitalea pollutisoli TaxID=3034143 RepID=UPI0023ECBF09|nr:DUF4199 domain-containing protein [Paraflavitalea sp. H1-2-19X]
MKKLVWIFGLLSGLIVTAMMVYSSTQVYAGSDFKGNEILGFTTIIVAFSFIYVGIKNYRDKHLGGVINFGKAFKVGLLIALIASSMYVGVWLIEYYVFMPDFVERYGECVMKNAREAGATAAELAQKEEHIASTAKIYETPLGVILMTYTEILPIGVVIALISSLILKRKPKAATEVA